MREYRSTQGAIALWEDKGDFAQSHHLYEAASEQYRTALTITPISDDDLLRISEKLAYVLFLGDSPTVATQWVDRVLEIHFAKGNAAKVVQMLNQMFRQVWLNAKTGEGLLLRERAIEIAERNGNPQIAKIAKCQLVDTFLQLSRYQEAMQLLSVIVKPQVSDDVSLRLLYYHVRASTLAAFGRATEAYAEFEHAIKIATKSLDLYHITTIWHDYAYWAMLLGDMKRAKMSLERALFIARQNHMGWKINHLCQSYAMLLFRMGRYESAREYLLEALDSGTDTPVLREDLDAIGIPLALCLHDKALLERCIHLETINLAFQSGEPSRIGGVVNAYAQYYVDRGNTSNIQTLLRRALKHISHIDDGLELSIEVALYGDSNDIAKTRDLFEKRLQLPFTDVVRAYLMFFEACIEKRYDRIVKSKKLAYEAIELFTKLSWHGWVDRVNLLIFAIPYLPKPSVQTKGGFTDLQLMLTEREQEIAYLVIRGLKNREIAAKLSIREHTVEKHMFSIMNRLGIRSRYQLQSVIESS